MIESGKGCYGRGARVNEAGRSTWGNERAVNRGGRRQLKAANRQTGSRRQLLAVGSSDAENAALPVTGKRPLRFDVGPAFLLTRLTVIQHGVHLRQQNSAGEEQGAQDGGADSKQEGSTHMPQ